MCSRQSGHSIRRGRRHGAGHYARRADGLGCRRQSRLRRQPQDQLDGGLCRREVQRRVRSEHLAAAGDIGRVPRLSRLHQGPADDARGRRHPFDQCRDAPAARSLRLPPAGTLVQGRALAGEASRADGHGDLPRKHRGHLCRHRVDAWHTRGGQGGRSAHARDGREEDPFPQDRVDRHQAAPNGSCGPPSTMRSRTTGSP